MLPSARFNLSIKQSPSQTAQHLPPDRLLQDVESLGRERNSDQMWSQCTRCFLPPPAEISAWTSPTHCKTKITPTTRSTVFTPAISKSGCRCFLLGVLVLVGALSVLLYAPAPLPPVDSVTLLPPLLLLKRKPACAALAARSCFCSSVCHCARS